jgi:hypothetical protein
VEAVAYSHAAAAAARFSGVTSINTDLRRRLLPSDEQR